MNVRRWLFFALALGLGSWVAAPASATAAGVIAAPAVEVDASELGTMPARMVAEVAASASQAVEGAGLPAAGVRVTFVELDPMTVERGVRVWLATDDATVLGHTKSVMDAGGSGVIFGRNVWQREWSEALEIIAQIKETLLANVKRTP